MSGNYPDLKEGYLQFSESAENQKNLTWIIQAAQFQECPYSCRIKLTNYINLLQNIHFKKSAKALQKKLSSTEEVSGVLPAVLCFMPLQDTKTCPTNYIAPSGYAKSIFQAKVFIGKLHSCNTLAFPASEGFVRPLHHTEQLKMFLKGLKRNLFFKQQKNKLGPVPGKFQVILGFFSSQRKKKKKSKKK